jgi:hypothetical protein
MDIDIHDIGVVPSRIEEMEREQILDSLMSILNGLLPEQAVKVVAHDPKKQEDGRHFTVSRLLKEE